MNRFWDGYLGYDTGNFVKLWYKNAWQILSLCHLKNDGASGRWVCLLRIWFFLIWWRSTPGHAQWAVRRGWPEVFSEGRAREAACCLVGMVTASQPSLAQLDSHIRHPLFTVSKVLTWDCLAWNSVSLCNFLYVYWSFDNFAIVCNSLVFPPIIYWRFN